MIKNDPDFPVGAYVFIESDYGGTTGIIIKAIKGRPIVRVDVGKKYPNVTSFNKKQVKVVTKENDPELFI